MNVTHLLNSDVGEGPREKEEKTTGTLTIITSISPEQSPSRRTAGSRLPSRNRTPWSADGFSLPLIPDADSIHTPSTAIPLAYTESPTESLTPGSPRSPEHKFSDSRSSQSSYTSSSIASSNNCSSHSRMSSISTVSGSQYPANPVLELHIAETERKSELDLEEAALGDEAHFQPITLTQFGHRPSVCSSMHSGQSSPKDTGRPASPSDVTLIKRTQPPESTCANTPDAKPRQNSFLAPEITRIHKRASSAPDFAAITSRSFANANPIPAPVPQRSPQEAPQGDSSTALEVDPYLPDPNDAATCLYMSECDTGSQPRKAISHLFGRNKLCTRLIPDSVWVHFCRKHYQRDRYRNGTRYAMTQCDLVLTQIRRVQAWGDQNKRTNSDCVLQDWSLALRKREQNRIESKKRRYQAEDGADEVPDRATLTGTAVPGWLLEKIGDGYTTAEMVAIVENIAADIEAGRLKAIPDIEILPNISTNDSADATKAKLCATRKRTFGTAVHKRSQSVGVVALPPQAYPMARRTSHPNTGYRGLEDSHSSPTEKRQRIEGIYEGYPGRNLLSSLPLRNTSRTVPTMDLPQRGVFTDIPEHRADDAIYSGRQPPSATGHYEYQTAQGPPPTLAHPRPTVLTMPPRLEPSPSPPSYHDYRRPGHQRSHSDVSAFHQSTSTAFRPVSSTARYPSSLTPFSTPRYDQLPAIESSATSHGRHPSTYDLAPPSGYFDETTSSQQPFRAGPSVYDNLVASRGRTMGGGPRHVRHQSTPVAPRPMQLYRNNSGPGAATSTAQQDQPTYGSYRHHSYASAHPGLAPAIQESNHVREDYPHQDYNHGEYDTHR